MAMKAVVTAILNGTRFYLTPDGLATDIFDRAETWSHGASAHIAAIKANSEKAWCGFRWEARNIVQGCVV